jgi:hypothetical protein
MHFVTELRTLSLSAIQLNRMTCISCIRKQRLIMVADDEGANRTVLVVLRLYQQHI